MKDRKFVFASVLIGIFLLTVGLTYAYFSLTVSGNDVAETINVDTTKLELKYTDGKEVKATNIEPGWTMTKTITVVNTGNEEAYYTLGWQKLFNEIQKEELVIRSECTSSGVTDGTCDNTDNVVVPQTSKVTAETNKLLYPYKEAAHILPGETHTYTVTIEFINYTSKTQNYNQGKKFYGVLGIVEAYNTYSLTLNVTNTDGTPVANSEVTLHSNPMTGTTDENGTVIFNDVKLGNHTLSVINNNTTIVTNLNIAGGKNNVTKEDDNYKVKYRKENVELDVIVDNNKISNIRFSSFAKYIIENYQSLGLTKISQTATGNQNYDTTEYRYQGASPNNYITFNNETGVWRIIGVFEVETPNDDGTYTKENKVKIVRDNIGLLSWDYRSSVISENKNDWTTSTLMIMLNSGPYYNMATGNANQECSVAFASPKCDYTKNGLTTTAKNQISSTKWYLGNAIFTENEGFGNTKEIYVQERSTDVHSGNKQTWDGKVALIYPSDYMYASSACYDDYTMKGDSFSGNNYRNEKCKSTNWLFDKDDWYWLISPSSNGSCCSMAADIFGHIGYTGVHLVSGGLHPSLYLNSDVNYISGNGTISDPFIIE